MRNMTRRSGLCAFVLAAMATGCAARAPRDTMSLRYDCDGEAVAVVVDGANASVRRDHKSDGLAMSRTHEAVEYTIPRDRLLDATVTRHSVGASPDRRLCIAEGGYTDALRRFLGGASIGDVAKQLVINEDDARKRIGVALARVRCRYHDAC